MKNNNELKQKIRLLNGMNEWRTYDELFQQITFSDGPTGLRYQEGDGDHLGMNDSKRATCFPTSSALACTWNRELVKEVSSAIAKEAKSEGVDVLLGPGVNIKRNPLCGRNFEYFSEDPYLTSELGNQFVEGLQENGVGACLKHFAGNNQEAYRMSIDTIIDERAREEIYFKVFKDIIENAKPWTIMSAYNKLMGAHCSENKWLLTETLREKWGYDGLVISDWYAVNDIVLSIVNGLDLEMPSVGEYSYDKLMYAYEQGLISQEAIDRAYNNLQTLRTRCNNKCKNSINQINYKEHHELARNAAKESIVLLKNHACALPIQPSDKVLYVGSLMKQHNFQGNGSSRVNPMQVDTITEFLDDDILYLPGYPLNSHGIDEDMVKDVLEMGKKVDKIIVFAGSNAQDEAESYDREDLKLPLSQRHLLDSLQVLNKTVILVLQTGAVVEIPWIKHIDAIVQSNYSGEGIGKAIVDILLGKENPSGKLNETYPIKLAHSPNYLYKGSQKQVSYNESIFVGYRYYDKKELDVLFPFGYGLSYTNFEYSDFNIVTNKEHYSISCNIKNTGQYDGFEVVQIYVGLNENREIQPIRQLKYFEKIFIKKGDTYNFECDLHMSNFRYFNSVMNDWTYATGTNTIFIGKSSRDIVFAKEVQIDTFDYKYTKITRNTTVGELFTIPELQDTINYVMDDLKGQLAIEEDEVLNSRELENSIQYMPLRNICQISKGIVSDEQLDLLIAQMNEQIGYGDKKL
ncbi:MAG: glycoside hydrolase family 3 C-terminal domain-containing protein [Vallitalea sp.]|jgi:beta-glucosidase|nr:glycoside hydrolase family 3 C-terminal domain-containing protein [Vallitalea sp.]